MTAQIRPCCGDTSRSLVNLSLQITALERARRIEELQKRLMDAEAVRTQYNRKVNILKDQVRCGRVSLQRDGGGALEESGPTPRRLGCSQVRATAQSANQERSLSDHQVQLLREDLASAKTALSEAARKETQVRPH